MPVNYKESKILCKEKKKNPTSIIVEDEQRDDDCVLVENSYEKTQINDNSFHLRDETIYMTFDGDCYKFIDVPGDGDCFYHIVLNDDMLRSRFNSVWELRQYLKNAVQHLYNAVQHL